MSCCYFDQTTWSDSSNAADRSAADLLQEFGLLRSSHIAVFSGFDDATWLRGGRAAGCEFTVRTFPFILLATRSTTAG